MPVAEQKAKPIAKPFLKWAGGKRQLINTINEYLPDIEQYDRYVESFVGAGAVMFHVLQNYNVNECHIYDKNQDLILAYSVIKHYPDRLIRKLKGYSRDYFNPDVNSNKFYYRIREAFNNNHYGGSLGTNHIDRAAQLIFLNKTGYNGLYRVNSKGGFNVPHGRYKNPLIADENNIKAVSNLLQKVHIHYGDFYQSIEHVDSNTFVYLDPPYKPVTQTSNFTSYTGKFTDEEQVRLSEFYQECSSRGAAVMLSNSDTGDDFFNNLYQDYYIYPVSAKRSINCNAQKRGNINELIITNYSVS